MAIKQFELYLDESGDFNEGKAGHGISNEPSMVGGLLCDPAYMTKERIDETFKGKVHACKGYSKSYLSILQTLHEAGCCFVVFENTEQIRIINSNYTYINIISEGLVHLFQDLVIEYPDGIHIQVIVAQRQMQIQEYQNRLKEKIIMALGRKQLTGIDYELVISDARTDKRLFFADIICNTWLTRNRMNTKGDGFRVEKFKPAERALINQMYVSRWVYPVFEDVTTTYLKQLLTDRHLGEAMLQLCALPKQTGFVKIRNNVIKAIENADSYEQDTWLTQMSLMIGQYNRLRRYYDGITLAENYLRYFLSVFNLSGRLKKAIPFWIFDTNFYLLTMYDHVGNAIKCQEYLKACQNNISAVNRSWEHIDYYFGFCIRELNVLMGRYAFHEVIERSEYLINIFKEARDLFGMIKTYNGTEQAIRSELLGKVYGVRLEAMINLLRREPLLLDEAIKLSEEAMEEFDDPRDISRQFQWRCLLMVEANHLNEAFNALMQSVNLPEEKRNACEFIDTIYAMKPGSYDFLLWHYTNVMLALQNKGASIGKQMAEALMTHPQFLADIKNNEKKGHPWNLVLWNTARYSRAGGDYASYKGLYRRAMEMTRANKANVTMMAFSLSMSADRLLWCREHKSQDELNAQMEFLTVYKELQKAGMTNEMNDVFQKSEIGDGKRTSNLILQMLSTCYLK